MSLEIILLALLAIQQVYWMRQTQKLVDRLMSRSYHEYRVAETVQPRQNVKKVVQEDFEQDTTAALDALF